ncbi:glycosyltransferase family 2 protein [Flavobacterium sp. NRK F10]|uniref:Glycosyltransferase family 2 protein n=1 Tax=Flavobacterium sediminis TaxID=2201181 RepID=A0A2U8QS62_9FLAO|nr:MULTISPECIES: glycosyltransferase family 2 protein [Flavobacterium]AWM12685.1 glycosyltransferase family 2 protein [Flavobacterium sediminis]MCO6173799.1 glycosyltransferase family 2 protein [Flavobacterium sp. NRK F10]
MPTLSVIIPTYNEIDYLEDAIRSVDFADEIIVIDSYSTDGTAELAEELGCKVLKRKFDNFSNQKNFALIQVKSDWILFIDADERVTQRLKAEILKAIESRRYDGYKINFPHFYMNRFLYHKVDRVLRLVKNNGVSFSGDVHEKLHVEGEIGILKNFMLHYTYKGLNHFLQKKDSYAWFQANMETKKGKKASTFKLIFKPFYRFFSSFILKRGFLDGVPGLAIASINAYGVFSRYAKMYLIKKGLK